MGPSQDRPHPISSAVAPLWSMEIIVSETHSGSCFTAAKSPTEWKKLTTWWAWTRLPRVSSAWGFLRLAACYLTNQRTVHQQNPSGVSGFRARLTRLHVLLPLQLMLHFPLLQLVSGDWLCCTQVCGLKFASVTQRPPRLPVPCVPGTVSSFSRAYGQPPH